MKICASHSIKLPHPDVDYGSIGASVSIETEPPEEIAIDRDKLRDYTDRLLAAARARCEEHLDAVVGEKTSRIDATGRQRPRSVRRNGNGSNGRRQDRNGSNTATPKQINFLRAIANEAGLGYGGLRDLAQDEFGTTDIRGLTKRQASQLIDELRV